MLVENPDHAIRVAERDEPIPQDFERERIAIRRRQV
jgi:hypothetical protein